MGPATQIPRKNAGYLAGWRAYRGARLRAVIRCWFLEKCVGVAWLPGSGCHGNLDLGEGAVEHLYIDLYGVNVGAAV